MAVALVVEVSIYSTLYILKKEMLTQTVVVLVIGSSAGGKGCISHGSIATGSYVASK